MTTVPRVKNSIVMTAQVGDQLVVVSSGHEDLLARASLIHGNTDRWRSIAYPTKRIGAVSDLYTQLFGGFPEIHVAPPLNVLAVGGPLRDEEVPQKIDGRTWVSRLADGERLPVEGGRQAALRWLEDEVRQGLRDLGDLMRAHRSLDPAGSERLRSCWSLVDAAGGTR